MDAREPAFEPASRRQRSLRILPEILAGASIAGAGAGLRLLFVARFPTVPVSDFRQVVLFGSHLAARGLAAPGTYWIQLNGGLPTVLALLFRTIPGDPTAIARAATAIATGLILPLLPFLLWRTAVSLRGRTLAGAMLALWPGQIFFSGVPAQDNWVLLPTVALASLAIRSHLLPGESRHPIVAGVLFAAGTAVRQEMAVVLLPFLIGASLAGRTGRRGAGDPIRAILASALCLMVVAGQRGCATGRFALTTEHGGTTLLGSVVPGAWAAGWIDPKPFVAAARPALLESRERLRSGAFSLAVDELGRRPGFHAIRMGGAAVRLLTTSDAENLFWSLQAPGALPVDRLADADLFSRRARPRLMIELTVIQGLFWAAVLTAVLRRQWGVLFLAGVALLKIAVQAVLSPMGRMAVPAIAIEILAIALASESWKELGKRARAGVVLLSAATALSLSFGGPALSRLVERLDRPERGPYRFPLAVGGTEGRAACLLSTGRLAAFDWRTARIETVASGGGEAQAEATCVIPASREPLILDVAGGGALAAPLPAARLRVSVDGRVATDEPLPGSGQSLSVALPSETRGGNPNVHLTTTGGPGTSLTIEFRGSTTLKN